MSPEAVSIAPARRRRPVPGSSPTASRSWRGRCRTRRAAGCRGRSTARAERRPVGTLLEGAERRCGRLSERRGAHRSGLRALVAVGVDRAQAVGVGGAVDQTGVDIGRGGDRGRVDLDPVAVQVVAGQVGLGVGRPAQRDLLGAADRGKTGRHGRRRVVECDRACLRRLGALVARGVECGHGVVVARPGHTRVVGVARRGGQQRHRGPVDARRRAAVELVAGHRDVVGRGGPAKGRSRCPRLPGGRRPASETGADRRRGVDDRRVGDAGVGVAHVVEPQVARR